MSEEIVPRWEWRSFGEFPPAVQAFFADLSPRQVVESDELYVVSTTGTDAVKVRDGLMDVKQLQQVADDGLEQWAPVMKATFPLSAADIGAVHAALAVEARPLTGVEYSLADLLTDVVEPNPQLRGIAVHKTRRRYLIDGCMAELTDVEAEGVRTQTIAIESEDAGLVVETVRRLGLPLRPNTSFPRGLKTLSGFGAGRYAVIDVGTNSVKFHLGERGVDGRWRAVVDRAAVTRLGEGLRDTGQLGPDPLQRTVEAIEIMAAEARQHGVSAIAAVGTAGLRIAENSDEFVAAVSSRTGVDVDVISGDEEARIAYVAATATLDTPGPRVVFDTGGGSSQFTFGEGDRVDERFSVNVGAVRFTEEFSLGGPVTEEALAAACAAIAADLERLDGRPSPTSMVGLGGGITNLAAVKHALSTYDPDVVQGTVLDRDEIDRQIELYRTRTAEERRAVVGLQPERAEVILAGACIVRTVLDKLGLASLTVSDRGLRHGVLIERFG